MDSRTLSSQLEKLPASGLTLELHRANWLVGVYLFFFLLLIISISLLPLLLWQTLLLIIGLCWYCQFLFRKHILLNHPESMKRLVFTELNWCYIQLNNAQIIKADIQQDTVVTEYLVILNFRAQSVQSIIPWLMKSYSITLSAAHVGNEDFRKLKRYLRLLSFSKIEKQKEQDEVIVQK